MVGEWQSMDTAPKDGSRFLSKAADGTVSVGWWERVEAPDVRDHVLDWLFRNGRKWSTAQQLQELIIECTPLAGKPQEQSFWTNEHEVFDCVNEEKELVAWMPLP